MKDIVFWKFIESHLLQDISVMLLIVLDSENSSPGRAGFKMAVCRNKDLFGSVGGGKMEFEIVNESLRYLELNKPVRIFKKLVHREDQVEQSSGMICSGSQIVYMQSLDKFFLPIVSRIIDSIETGKVVKLQINPGKIILTDTDFGKKNILFKYKDRNDWCYEEIINRKNKLYIIGGGHVGLALSKVMSLLDFSVIIIDNRDHLVIMDTNQFADEKLVVDFNFIADIISEGDQSYVAIVTHSHETDTLVLQKLITHNFKYLGVLGSRSKIENLFAGLIDSGVDRSAIDKIHAPIGLSINSKTPEEIAISIAAEIIKIKYSN